MADEPLLAAAARIADGDYVDWGTITDTLPSPEDRALADELAVVARIAAGHRELHHILPADADTPPNLIPDRARWAHLDLLNIVGRGSYGTVYRAWDTRLERLVALKLFHGASNPEAVMQEGRMLARIRHENVVTVYGADVSDGVAGIWMELVHGRTLDAIVRKDGPMSARDAAAVGVDIARALDAVHEAGLLHCDVKAQNVVREATGRVVLMDLGAGRLAPEYRDADEVSDVAGTPRYMAPELFKSGTAATIASDIYSFGILLYFLVTGRFPIEGRTLGELKHAHESGKSTPLREARKGLPAAFVDVVSRAIDRNPAKRPESAVAVEDSLDAFLGRATARQLLSRWQVWLAAALMALAMAAMIAGCPRWSGPASNVLSIAVLPVTNLSGDQSAAYVADGITEMLIGNLARLKDVRIPSFAAVAPMKSRSDGPAAMTDALGVDLLLAGTILEVEPTLRISVQLIDRKGIAIWGEEIRGTRSRILTAQAEFVRKLAARLGLTITEEEHQRLAQLALDPRAEDAYLRGLAATVAAPARAEEAAANFRNAIEIAPTFAPAWAELAMAEMVLLEQAAPAEQPSRIARIRELAGRAIELDPAFGRGYAALGTVQFYYDWDFDAAEGTLRAGLDHSPSDAFLRQRLSMLLAARGRLEEAIALGREAQRLEPLVPFRSTSLGTLYYYERDYEKAIAEMQRALSITPGFAIAEYGLGRVYSAQGRTDEALAAIERALGPLRYPEWLAEYARVLLQAGRRRDAERVLSELSQQPDRGTPYPEQEAHRAIVLGEHDRAFAILERAIESRSLGMLWLLVDPRVDPLRRDPRFTTLLSRIGVR